MDVQGLAVRGKVVGVAGRESVLQEHVVQAVREVEGQPKAVFAPALPAGCLRERPVSREETALVPALVSHDRQVVVDNAACVVEQQGECLKVPVQG